MVPESFDARFLRLLGIGMQGLSAIYRKEITDPGQAFVFTCFSTLDFIRHPDITTPFWLLPERFPQEHDPEFVQVMRMALEKWREQMFLPPATYPFSCAQTEQSLRTQGLLAVASDGDLHAYIPCLESLRRHLLACSLCLPKEKLSIREGQENE